MLLEAGVAVEKVEAREDDAVACGLQVLGGGGRVRWLRLMDSQSVWQHGGCVHVCTNASAGPKDHMYEKKKNADAMSAGIQVFAWSRSSLERQAMCTLGPWCNTGNVHPRAMV